VRCCTFSAKSITNEDQSIIFRCVYVTDVARTPPSASAQSISSKLAMEAAAGRSPSAHSLDSDVPAGMSISPTDVAVAATRKKIDKVLYYWHMCL
jgi:hypothetical protein